uniref:Xylosyltransferase 1 n=1 Tax=Rhizophora mucronata TaxID=61149 RepID=A0A2P2NUE5_RHIMU
MYWICFNESNLPLFHSLNQSGLVYFQLSFHLMEGRQIPCSPSSVNINYAQRDHILPLCFT